MTLPNRPLASSPLGFRDFWARFCSHLWSNFRRYFWPPLLGSIVVILILARALLWFERGRGQGVDTFTDAMYAVGLFMVTVGYRADSLSAGGRSIGLMSSVLGLVVFGISVTLVFYSLQD